MKINGTASVSCSVCGLTADYPIVQMINPATDPANHARLLRGELNLAECSCGKRTQLAANVVFHDPVAKILCHVCPEGEAAMQRAEQAFSASFAGAGAGAEAGGLQRIVPSLNALVEKLKIAEAVLEDWAVEMTKVLLLASIPIDDDDRVMLFVRADEATDRIHWLLFDAYGENPAPLTSPLPAYHRLVATSGGAPPADQRRIDRAWAIEAVRQMIASGN